MKTFLRTHLEAVLISCTVLFIVVIGGFLYSTIDVVFTEINRAIGSVSVQEVKGFDLQTAAKIDFRGILTGTVQQPKANTSIPPLAPVVIPPPAAVIMPTSSSAGVASSSATSSSLSSSSTPLLGSTTVQ
jgi:hypothetical protein